MKNHFGPPQETKIGLSGFLRLHSASEVAYKGWAIAVSETSKFVGNSLGNLTLSVLSQDRFLFKIVSESKSFVGAGVSQSIGREFSVKESDEIKSFEGSTFSLGNNSGSTLSLVLIKLDEKEFATRLSSNVPTTNIEYMIKTF